MEKLIIYKDLAGLKVTPVSNYNARIRNERKVTDCHEFEDAEQIREYFVKYFGSRDDDFVDMT